MKYWTKSIHYFAKIGYLQTMSVIHKTTKITGTDNEKSPIKALFLNKSYQGFSLSGTTLYFPTKLIF
jgi:hypothetical protein